MSTKEPHPLPAPPAPALMIAPELADGAGPTAIRGGVLRAASFAAGLTITLVSAPLLIRRLGDAGFGSYAKVLAVVAIVAGLTDAGVNTIAVRDLSATVGRAAQDLLIGELLGLRLALSSVGVCLAITFSAMAGYGAELVLGTALAGMGLMIMLTQSLIAAVLQSRLRFGWAALIELVRQLVTMTLIVGLVLARANVVAFLAVTIPAGFVGLVLTVLLVRHTITLRPAFHPRRWLPLVRDTLVFAVAIAVNTLYFRITLIILALVTTAAETGYFAISYRITEVLITVPGLLIGAAFPIISRTVRHNIPRFEAAAGRIFELGLFLGALLSMCLMLAAPFAIQVLVGTARHPSVRVLEIQSWALTAGFVASATGYPLLSMRRNRETLLANCVSLVLAVFLALMLAPAYGARGAAAAAVAADFALAATNTLMLVRSGGPRLPFSAIPVTALAALAGCVAGRAIGIHPLVEAVAGALAYLFVLVALRRFPPEARELLRWRRGQTATQF